MTLACSSSPREGRGCGVSFARSMGVGVRPRVSVGVLPDVSAGLGGLAVGLWHGRGGVGGGAVVFHPPAGPVDGDDVAVVEEAVEDGGGEDFVGEDLAPFAEGLVAGDDDGAFLVAAGDDLKDEV